MTRAEAQTTLNALTTALNAVIADIERTKLLRASIVTSYSGPEQSVRVEVTELSPWELDARGIKP